jgi:hypothetical protein
LDKLGRGGKKMWENDQYEFTEFQIRGREYDPKMLGIQSVKPPTTDAPYWEIGFKNGSTIITDDVITIRLKKLN